MPNFKSSRPSFAILSRREYRARVSVLFFEKPSALRRFPHDKSRPRSRLNECPLFSKVLKGSSWPSEIKSLPEQRTAMVSSKNTFWILTQNQMKKKRPMNFEMK